MTFEPIPWAYLQACPMVCFFVTTERENDPRVRIGVDPEQWSATISINPLSAQNMNDIEAFLDQSLSKPGIRIYLDRYRACEAEFVKIMKDKSAGNFMYLRYAIDDIERGAYDDDEPSHLPQGLEEYYESHLRRMREHSGSEWYMYKLPIICAIASNPHPVTLDMILTHAGLMDSNETEQTRKRAIAADILVEWGAFVQRVKINGAAGPVIGYSFYHESFRHFLRKRTGMSIRESRVYDQVRRNIATDLTKKIFGES
ncbi:MAG: hypothetical protein IPO15_25530 [Anaerolineae bacterium]|uniref:hypothetical protein n=1 Tax=Candidatus Amarolinea dominans TaxID=3140696 RepID=UPI003135AD18|nr:hypothetical protein [Anaerolineae bacterium]